MPRPRKPNEVLELSGSFTKNPNRRRTNPKSNLPVGDAPDWLNDDEHLLWHEIMLCLPDGVATRPDCFALAVLVSLLYKERKRIITAIERTQLLRLLSGFGMTPADRTRVIPAPVKNKNDEFDEFA